MAEDILDVLVVGAGPVGLFCANELTRHGIRCRIIDKKAGLSDKSKALAIHIRTLDVLEDCGFIEEFLAQGLKVDGVLLKAHGRLLVDVNFSLVEGDRHYLIDLPQDKTEQILYAELMAKGLKVEWQTELTGIEPVSNHTIATLKQADGSNEQVNAAWIIACDGSHSTLRHLVNADFLGSTYKEVWWLADLLIDWNLPENKMALFVTHHGPMAAFPMGDKRYRLVLVAPEGSTINDTPTMQDIEQAFIQRCSESATLSNPLWITQFGIHHRQIQQYRHGRVFFAGDAAHIHSPMGGQGLNTGIQDIYNLIWKLALVKKGLAQDSLLDSYHKERYPIGKEVLKKTDFLTKLITIRNPFLIYSRNTLVRFITSFKFVKRYFTRDMAELSISYANSPIVKTLGIPTKFKIGEFAPNFSFTDIHSKEKKQLHQMIQGTMHHLFLFAGQTKSQFPALLETAALINQQFKEIIQVHVVLSDSNEALHLDSVLIDDNQEVHQQFAIQQTTALLIRPDKYIGLTQAPVNKDSLLAYMKTIYISK
ncbi:FAD-dependent monooxygenase [Legionella feeleii]|uniref:FAD dependent oxidoreductase n=1 Tax=Legionella feeleii TaxID=453 RepID=A0A0W0TVL9_9GAMM|nr:FAD-dependent monooxygenase [Legionella feeleii]KTC99747.1 FAD dependent oxidoreductase [Legionella feeleii]SPX60468.1 FAD dependent oxidoreductase [Legionella feeleii]